MIKKGQEIELKIEKFADRGKSLARIDGYVVFVQGAVPGDTVLARVGRRKRKYAEARLLKVLDPGVIRTTPRCPYFGACGGCKWQHVTYEAQCEAKEQSVREALIHMGGLSDPLIRSIVPADIIYGYRNKMEFSFGARRWLTDDEIGSGASFDTTFALGLHAPGGYNKLIDIAECHIQPEKGNAVLSTVRNTARAHGWSVWDVRKQKGYLRHLVLRMSAATEDMMVNLVTGDGPEERIREVADTLRAETPFVTTFVHTLNTGPAQTSYGEATRVLFGPGTITDRIDEFNYTIGPSAFFQTNTPQAEKLYHIARDYADLTKNDLVYDLYCGAGTISLCLAGQAKKVIGIELIEETVKNARENGRRNQVQNVTFVAGDMLKTLNGDFFEKHGKPDVLVLDPPRAGIHPKVGKQIAAARVDRIVYVSCNPQTLARDIGAWSDVYELVEATPVDLFPHTHHTECVAKLRLKR